MSQRLARLDPVTTGRARAGRRGRARVRPDGARAGAPGATRRRCWARSTWPLRSGMVAAVPERPLRLLLRARAGAPGAVRPADRRRAGPSCTCARARRSRPPRRSRRRARSPTWPTTSPPPRPLGGTERAVDYNLRAAAAATAALAFDEAVAARCARRCGWASPTATARPRSSSRSGERLLPRRAVAPRRSTPTAASADIARDLGDGELFARAAVGFENACWRMARGRCGALELLTEASARARRRATPRCG